MRDVQERFEDAVRLAFRELLGDGRLRVIDVRRDPAFGNALVTMSAPGFLVRAVRDRGEVYADVAVEAAEPAAWYPLHLAIAAADSAEPPRPRLMSLAEHAAALAEAWPRLVDAFSRRDAMEERLQRARRAVSRRFLAELP